MELSSIEEASVNRLYGTILNGVNNCGVLLWNDVLLT